MLSRTRRRAGPTRAARTTGTLFLVSGILLLAVASGEAQAAKKKKHPAGSRKAPAAAPAETDKEPAEEGAKRADQATEDKPGDEKKPLDFDFFADKPGTAGGAKQPHNVGTDLAADDAEAKTHTRRWMLRTHQTLGITTWALLASTVVVGQLNYNQLYGGGGGSPKWQSPHRWLVLSTSVMFATTATFSIFAPNPYPKPLRLDTGLVHRIAVIGATLGMISEAVLGWVTTHQANAGNPNNLRSMARTHQIIGYSTLGFLTVAGVVWVF